MRLQIDIPIALCEKMEEYSYYNHVFYLIPFTINGCNVFHEDWGGDEYYHGGALGIFENGKFVEKIYLHNNDGGIEESFTIDTECIDAVFKWT